MFSWFCAKCILKKIFKNYFLTEWQLPVWESVSDIFEILYVKLKSACFSPTGQDAYDKTGNNNTVEVSAKATLVSLR